MSTREVGRRIRNYRWMFRMSLGGVILGALATAGGFLSLFFTPQPTLITTGILLLCLSVLNGYKLVLSTMSIIDREGADGARLEAK